MNHPTGNHRTIRRKTSANRILTEYPNGAPAENSERSETMGILRGGSYCRRHARTHFDRLLLASLPDSQPRGIGTRANRAAPSGCGPQSSMPLPSAVVLGYLYRRDSISVTSTACRNRITIISCSGRCRCIAQCCGIASRSRATNPPPCWGMPLRGSPCVTTGPLQDSPHAGLSVARW